MNIIVCSATLLLSISAVSAKIPCSDGLYIIAARATNEAPGQGRLGGLSTLIEGLVPNSNATALVYPAAEQNFFVSENEGVQTMTKQIQDYVASCPENKIALMGYSQGALVVNDVLCGSTHPQFIPSAPLSQNYNKSIAAIILMADPGFMPGLPFDAGTSKIPGVSQAQTAIVHHTNSTTDI